MSLTSCAASSRRPLTKNSQPTKRVTVHDIFDTARHSVTRIHEDRKQTIILEGRPKTIKSAIGRAELAELLAIALNDIAVLCKRGTVITVKYDENILIFIGISSIHFNGMTPSIGQALADCASAANANAELSWYDGYGPSLVLYLPASIMNRPTRKLVRNMSRFDGVHPGAAADAISRIGSTDRR